ncbi:MAG: hypothetical protein NXI04_10445 [Planctomycetaceae bacterium]|nr:hypothetical protein [Planctomycetaceae bacterium]
MGDLRSRRLICVKGGLFLVCGLTAAGLLLAEHRDLKTAALLAIAVWSFCRCYYFAFYVVQHYVDAEYRFRGLFDFLRYLLGHRRTP